MSDRVKGFYVSLEKDIRDDDFQTIMNAVLMVKGVLSVEPSITSADDWMNRERVKFELRKKIFDILAP